MALSAMSVGLSAIYPNLKEDNPSKIVSGFGGTLNLILSLGYVVLVVVLEAVPCHLYFANVIDEPELKFWVGIGVGVVVLITAAAVVIPLWLGVRAIRKMEL
jgi:ABC-2 type transport system permease protein